MVRSAEPKSFRIGYAVNTVPQHNLVTLLSYSANIALILTVGLTEVGAEAQAVDILLEIDVPVDF